MTGNLMANQEENREVTPEEIVAQKLRDVEIAGHEVEFDPEEAERIAFREDALSDQDARESVADL